MNGWMGLRNWEQPGSQGRLLGGGDKKVGAKLESKALEKFGSRHSKHKRPEAGA
jgi:hypothetical protein